VIDAVLVELDPVVGTKQACALVGRPRASHYRRLRPVVGKVQQPRPAPPNALSLLERDAVLALLRCPANCDLAVAHVWARELDNGRYHCSS